MASQTLLLLGHSWRLWELGPGVDGLLSAPHKCPPFEPKLWDGENGCLSIVQKGYLGLLTGANAERTPLCATKSKTRLQPNQKQGNRNGSTSASNALAGNNKSLDWNLCKVGVPLAAGGNFQRSLAHGVGLAAYHLSAQMGPRFYLVD